MKPLDDHTSQRLCMDAAHAVAALLTPGSGFDLDAVNDGARDAVSTARDDLLAMGCLAYVLSAQQEIPASPKAFAREGGGGATHPCRLRPAVHSEGPSLAIAGSPSTRPKNFGVSKK